MKPDRATASPDCPRCRKQKSIRYGFVLGRQRWLCRACQYQFSVGHMIYKPFELKQEAARRYEAGLSSNRVSEELRLSPTTVLLWSRLLTPPEGRIHQMKVRWDKVLPPHVRAELRAIQRDLRQLTIQLKQFDEDERIFTRSSPPA